MSTQLTPLILAKQSALPKLFFLVYYMQYQPSSYCNAIKSIGLWKGQPYTVRCLTVEDTGCPFLYSQPIFSIARKKDRMKKRSRFLRFIVILVAVTVLVDAFIVVFVDKDFFKSEVAEISKEGVSAVFTNEEALEKIKNYKITQQLHSPEIEAGRSIEEAYEIKGDVPAIKNIEWFTEDTDQSEVFVVGYRQTISGSLQEPRWEVSKDKIRALNGKAVTITPEFGPESW